ncbi:MAG: ABC transporter substrate-binding protein [Ilumatobacteraceae bacterium]
MTSPRPINGKRLLALAVGLTMLAAACGGDDDSSIDSTVSATAGAATVPDSASSEDPAATTAVPESTDPAASETSSPTADEGSGPNPDAEEIMIGGTYPLTGALATDGQEMANAIEIAVDHVNAAGGIKSLDGAAVRWEALDSTGAPEVAATNVQSLIDDGAVGIIGAWLSSNTIATTQVAERAGIPHIVDQSLSDEILSRGFQYTFRVMFDSKAVGNEGAKWLDAMLTQLDMGRKLVLLHEESTFGTTNANAFEAAAANYDFELVDVIAYSAATTDLSAEVAQAISSGANVLLSVGYGPDSLLLLETLDEQGADFDAIVGVDSAGWYSDRFAEQAQGLAEGIFDAASYPVDHTSDEYQTFYDDYVAKFDVVPSDGAILSYTSARVLLEAIENAGTTDPEAIREELATGTFDSHMMYQDSIRFDETGQNTDAAPIMYQFQDGKRVVVLPEEIAAAPIRDPRG